MKRILFLGAFLLILVGASVYYFVGTKIEEDKGITVKLPPWQPEGSESEDVIKIKQRNVLKVEVDEKGDAIIREEKVDVQNIKTLVKDFISNPTKKENFAASPGQAIISLSNTRTTPYKKYLNIYNEIKGAYNELWDAEARKQFNRDYKALNREEQKAVRKVIPLVISEAEPTDF